MTDPLDSGMRKTLHNSHFRFCKRATIDGREEFHRLRYAEFLKHLSHAGIEYLCRHPADKNNKDARTGLRAGFQLHFRCRFHCAIPRNSQAFLTCAAVWFAAWMGVGCPYRSTVNVP
jgi:hypothetical protein